MPVTKRTRYEVLKRDNHTCRYCGGTAPDVKLTVDRKLDQINEAAKALLETEGADGA